jgi:hypothetical protein
VKPRWPHRVRQHGCGSWEGNAVLVEKPDRLYRRSRTGCWSTNSASTSHFVNENVIVGPECRSADRFLHGIKVLGRGCRSYGIWQAPGPFKDSPAAAEPDLLRRLHVALRTHVRRTARAADWSRPLPTRSAGVRRRNHPPHGTKRQHSFVGLPQVNDLLNAGLACESVTRAIAGHFR